MERHKAVNKDFQKVSWLLIRGEFLTKLHPRATGRHLSYGITRCHLSPDTSEHTRLNPSQTGWYL